MNGDATLWYPREHYSSVQDAYNDNLAVIQSKEQCEAFLGVGNCSSGVMTLSAGNYTTTAPAKKYYLKHTVVNDIVTASYVYFVAYEEICMQGGDMDASTESSPYYSANRYLLEDLDNWYHNHNGTCGFGSHNSYCAGGSFNRLEANFYGNVSASTSDADGCYVISSGASYCTGSSPDVPVPGDTY